MIVPHPYYRLNPGRAVYINGVINRDLVSRITPEILKLQATNRDPITVYIDSPGGNVNNMETILRMLNLSDQDSSGPCHVITAVTTRAASAAADLLSSGDYAIAYPHSTILYHGIRTQESNPLTVESTSVLTNILRRSNDIYAINLARKIEDRFSFRFLFARNEFSAVRAQHPDEALSDFDCFVEFIDEKLSSEGKKVWQRAKDRHSRYSELFQSVRKKVKGDFGKMTMAQVEGVAIKAIVEFEVKANKNNPAWSFRGGGIERLNDDFFLFNEYLTNFGGERLKKWSEAWGRYVIPTDLFNEIISISDETERTQKMNTAIEGLLHPLTSFFAALCHALQEGENELSAEDAYWLGLIDEVVGQDHLLCLRHFEENKPDVPVPDNANQADENQQPPGPTSA